MNHNSTYNLAWQNQTEDHYKLYQNTCTDYRHYPGALMVYIPPGSSYTYTCPSCGHETVIYSHNNFSLTNV